MRGAPVAALLFLLLLQPAFEADGQTLYVRRTLIAERGPLTVGQLVQAPGELPVGLHEALELQIAEVGDTISLVPSTSYRHHLDKASAAGIIIVGKRTLVVPKGSIEDGAVGIIDKLADYMEGQGLIGQGRVDFENMRISEAPGQDAGESPTFKQYKLEKKGALAVGAAEFLIQPSGGRITMRVRQEAGAAVIALAPGVKANDAVDVFFRKGSIVIHMSGKALASAREGERVGVYVPESRMNFTGTVMENKAVSIEIDGD